MTRLAVLFRPHARLLCLVAAIVLWQPMSWAQTPRVPVAELDLAVSDDPRTAARKAADWLAEGRANGDKMLQLNGLRLSAKAHEQGEQPSDLKKAVDAGLALARELRDLGAEAEFLIHQANLLAGQNKYDQAKQAFDEAIAFSERHNQMGNVAMAQADKSHIYITQASAADAMALLVKSHTLFEAQQYSLGMAYALSLMAQAMSLDAADESATRRAIDYSRRAIALLDPKKSRHDISVHYHNLGVDYARIKERALAREYFLKSRVIVTQLGDRVSAAYLDYRIAELDREEGNLPPVLPALARALPSFEETDNTRMQLLALLSRTRVQAMLDQRAEATKSLSRAREVAKRIDASWAEALIHEVTMELYARQGEYEKAFREAASLRKAEQAASKANNAEKVAELELRFDSRQKETENQLLRARQQESDARRLALVLGLVLSLSLLTGVTVFFARQTLRNRRFETLAMRDDLTGLPNRRSILEFARSIVDRRPAQREPVIVAIIDIDHFKSINDEFGHAQGDAVLLAFAATCQKELRADDRMGRFGGEEFLLVMPSMSIEQMPAVFERVRQSVMQMQVAGLPADRRITFSMGAAARALPTDGTAELIQRADRALYRAKEGGRDRLEIG